MTDINARIAEPVNHMEYLLGETYRERLAQIKRRGRQHRPVLKGEWARLVYEAEEVHYKKVNDNTPAGEHSWDAILLEEVYEALAERVPAKQIEELVQVAAVALAMAEDLMTQEEETNGDVD